MNARASMRVREFILRLLCAKFECDKKGSTCWQSHNLAYSHCLLSRYAGIASKHTLLITACGKAYLTSYRSSKSVFGVVKQMKTWLHDFVEGCIYTIHNKICIESHSDAQFSSGLVPIIIIGTLVRIEHINFNVTKFNVLSEFGYYEL